MSKLRGAVRLGIASVAVGCALAITGCGGEEDPAGGTATVLMAGGPDYLDPQLAHTTKAAEANWLAYTPLLTYRHRSGSDGAHPGARREPSPDLGKRATVHLQAARGPYLLEREAGQGE